MSEYEFTISLRIRHPDIEPEQITRVLGIDPQHTWKAGDARRNESNQQIEGTYRESYWTGRLMDKPQSASGEVTIESVLLQKLAKLRLVSPFLRDLNIKGGAAELLISVFARENFKLELLAESLALLARLGLDISIDVQAYPAAAIAKAS